MQVNALFPVLLVVIGKIFRLIPAKNATTAQKDLTILVLTAQEEETIIAVHVFPEISFIHLIV